MGPSAGRVSAAPLTSSQSAPRMLRRPSSLLPYLYARLRHHCYYIWPARSAVPILGVTDGVARWRAPKRRYRRILQFEFQRKMRPQCVVGLALPLKPPCSVRRASARPRHREGYSLVDHGVYLGVWLDRCCVRCQRARSFDRRVGSKGQLLAGGKRGCAAFGARGQ